MSDEIKEVQDRLRKIEEDLVAERATRTANKRWATVAGFVLISWLGFTSFYQIPKAVDQSSTGQVAREAEQARDRAVKAADQARINAGRLRFEKKCVARDSNGCKPIVPPCSPGFREAFPVSDLWNGGTCGKGELCRVCYTFDENYA